jgi:pimeloyl-ACP methyl ester carboxylesterase
MARPPCTGLLASDRASVVFTAGRDDPPGLSPADAAALRKLWVDELQPELARLSTRGRRTLVDGSGHLVPLEKPQAVVDAVQKVVVASRPPWSRFRRYPVPARF